MRTPATWRQIRMALQLAGVAFMISAAASTGQTTSPRVVDGSVPAKSAPPEGPGQRVFVCGNSFQSYVGGPLDAIAWSAGIAHHRSIGYQHLDSSDVRQHWELPYEKNKVKKAIEAEVVDVLLLAPGWNNPDDAVSKFANLLLEHTSRGRVLLMAPWQPYDFPRPNGIRENAARDTATGEELRKAYAPAYETLRKQVEDLRRDIKEKRQGRFQAVLLVPVGTAVINLRERVAAGRVPGITKQSELFTDALGHPQWPIKLLAGYCHFAVIYNQNPVGLEMNGLPEFFVNRRETTPAWNEGLNRVLQEVAWDAVKNEPLSRDPLREDVARPRR